MANRSNLFAILNIVSVILLLLSFDGFVISYDVSIVIGFNIHFSPMHADIQIQAAYGRQKKW